MTLNTDTHDTSDLTDAEIQTVLDLVGTVCQPATHRSCASSGYVDSKAYILLTRSLKVSHPEMFQDPDVEAVRAILVEEYGDYWKKSPVGSVEDTSEFRAYMNGKAAP